MLVAALLLIAFLIYLRYTRADSGKIQLAETTLTFRTVAKDLYVPWEILWGPDDWIWFTQRNGFVKRLNPETGEVKELLSLTNSFEYTSSGTLGMALHPNFNDSTYVYLVYCGFQRPYAVIDKGLPSVEIVADFSATSSTIQISLRGIHYEIFCFSHHAIADHYTNC